MEDKEYTNIFEEEFLNIAGKRNELLLHDVLKINLFDENNEYKINLSHIRKYCLNSF